MPVVGLAAPLSRLGTRFVCCSEMTYHIPQCRHIELRCGTILNDVVKLRLGHLAGHFHAPCQRRLALNISLGLHLNLQIAHQPC